MSNSILTATAVTREALRILHQKLNFIGNINREYDDSYAKTGAKIGDTLKIRLPNRYTVRTGRVMSDQDTTETFTSLQVATQKGVDLNFTSVDLTLSLDDFSKRILDPAMSVLAANIEADAFSMINSVYNYVKNIGSAITFAKVLAGRKALQDNLAPTGDRFCILNTQDNVDLVDALKGLFQDSRSVAEQYKEGMMGRTAGFDFYENTLIPTATTGTAPSNTTYLVNGSQITGSALTVDTGTAGFAVGDIIVISGCLACHPETKASMNTLQPFVIQTAVSSAATTLSIDPPIFMSGGQQNVVLPPTDNANIYKVGEASAIYKPSLVFHKDAFTFATADLVMPKNQHFAAREVMDGISMRIWQGTDIVNDKFPCRVDVLYGYKAIRPQLAARILSN